MKQLILAAAQITCQDGNISENLARATAMAKQAQEQGVQLILFPEFMPQGYRLTPGLWDAGEPFDGTTTRWLSETARTLGIYVGTSFLEASGGHFFNTFALADTSGKIAGAVCKRNPPCGKRISSKENTARNTLTPTSDVLAWESVSTTTPTRSPAPSPKAILT